MTIHQLREPCWTITPRLSDEDGDPCYDTRADALADIREAWDTDREHARGLVATALERAWWREFCWRLSRLRPGAPKPRQAGRCWVAACDGECEMVLDEEDECCVFHHGSAAEAGKTVASYWVLDGVHALTAPVQCGGALRLWPVPEDVEKAVRAQLEDR
jgi:hypothetical protein